MRAFTLPCDCCACLRFSDDFSSSSTLGNEPVTFPTPIPGVGDWHEIGNAGNWSITGGVMTTTANGSNSVYLYLDTSSHEVFQEYRADFDLSVSGSAVGVIGFGSSSSQRIEFSSTAVKWYNARSGGTKVRECSFSGSGAIRIESAQRSTGSNTTLFINGVAVSSFDGAHAGAPQFWKVSGTGSYTLDNFKLYWMGTVVDTGLTIANCPTSDTNYLLWPIGNVSEITVVISNAIANPNYTGGSPCATCSSLNGTYVLTRTYTGSYWAYRSVPITTCIGLTYLEVRTNGYNLYCNFESNFGGSIIQDLTSECGNAGSWSGTFDRGFGSATTDRCNFDWSFSI